MTLYKTSKIPLPPVKKNTVYFRVYINKCCYSANKLWLPWNIFEFHRKQRYPVKRKWRKCPLGCKTLSVSTLRFWLKLSIGGTALREIRRENTLLTGAVWWPRTAIRNFLDNSRKFNFCNRLILKLLHFFSIKKILKMYFLFFKDNLFLKRLNSFDFWKYYKLFLKR